MCDDLDPKEFEDTAKVVIEACAAASDTKARAQLLAEAGLLGVCAPEDVGGLALPLQFAVPIVSAAAADLLAFPLIETMLLAHALAASDKDMARQICSGEVVATIAWAEADLAAGGVAPLAVDAEQVLMFSGDGTAVLTPLDGKAKTAPQVTLDLEAPATALSASDTDGGIVLDRETVKVLRQNAQILRTAFVIGSAARCLELAAEYAQDRTQFGKPLSANQVLRHRLSRDALAIETMRNSLARALATSKDNQEMARSAAWLGAAKAGPLVAESAIQVFGGMGFTWEVPLHRHLRQMRAQAIYGAVEHKLGQLAGQLLSGTNNTWYKEIANVV